MRKELKKLIGSLVFIFWLGVGTGNGVQVYAIDTAYEDQEIQQELQEMLDQYDFENVQNALDESNADWDFSQVVSELMSGKINGVMSKLLEYGRRQLKNQISLDWDSMGQVLVLGCMSAILTCFAGIFADNGMSDHAFYFIYMILLTVLLGAFYQMSNLVSQLLSYLVEFMQAVIPAYALAIGAAGGSASALGYYEITLIVIQGIQILYLRVLIPAIRIFVVLCVVQHLAKENYISKTIACIKKGITWTIKTVIAFVFGIHIIQGMLLPSVDIMKNTTMYKAVSMIPGIGNTVGFSADLFLGTARLIKNSLGTGICIVLLLLCIAPVCKLALTSLGYQLMQAVMQPICDGRMIQAIHGMTQGLQLLLYMTLSVVMLFLLSIAILCIATNIS